MLCRIWKANPSLRLVSMHDVSIAVGLQAFLAPFTANARLLVSREERLRRRLFPRVDPYRSSLKLLANTLRTLDVLAPDTSAEAGVCVVRASDDLSFVRPWLRWYNWAKWLFGDDLGVVGRVVDDRWLHEVALRVGDVWRAGCELVAVGFGVGEEALDFLELHGVLNWSEECALVGTADLDALRELDLSQC